MKITSTADQRSLIFWPAEATGLVLEFASQLSPAPNWRPVTPASAANAFVTPFNQPLRYFRLRKP